MDKVTLHESVHVYIGRIFGPGPEGADYATVWQTEAGFHVLTGKAARASIRRMELKAMTQALRHFRRNVKVTFHLKTALIVFGVGAHARLDKNGTVLTKAVWPYGDYHLWKALFGEMSGRAKSVAFCHSTMGKGFDDDGIRLIHGLMIQVPTVMELSNTDGLARTEDVA